MPEMKYYVNREFYTDGKFLYNCHISKKIVNYTVVEEMEDIRIVGVIEPTSVVEFPTHFNGKKIKSIEHYVVYKKGERFPENIDTFVNIPCECTGGWLGGKIPNNHYLIETKDLFVEKIRIGNIGLSTFAFSGVDVEQVEFLSPLCEIPYGFFYNCTSLKNVVLPQGVKRIRSSAFYACKNLKNIILTDSITKIATYAFYNSGIEMVVLPPHLETITQYTFRECMNLKYVVIPPTVKSISHYAFYKSNNITIVSLTGSAAHNFAKKNCIEFIKIEQFADMFINAKNRRD